MLCSWLSTIAGGIVVLCVSLKIFLPYFWQDLIYFLRRKRSKATVEKWAKNGILSIIDLFMHRVEKSPHKPFLIYEGTVYTYHDVDRRSNRVAQAFLHYGNLKKGDTVALLMGNGPDFIHVWFGLAKLGFIVAFLNINIHSRSLLHCINTCEAKALVIGEDCLGSIEKEFILNLLEINVAVWLMSTSSPSQHVHTLSDKLEKVPDNPVPSHLRAVTDTRNTALYIFTSGSTGFPKAAIITHLRTLAASLVFTQCGAVSQDIMYVTLPLYHISASLLGISGCIQLGATCVLKKKFSARQFWNDCRKYNVTMFLYIGELCRYLCNQPCKEEDRVHEVRIALGNGIRPSVWKEFLMRFGPIKIFEFYGSTEGSLAFLNYTNKIGAVGRAGIFSKFLHSFELLKYDVWKQELIKDENRRCKRAHVGKPGLLVFQVTEDSPFSGYVGNKEASEKKLLRNVFLEGDVYFDTGDLLVMDEDGFLYFTDRVGDTFRWKGENVATLEVAEVISMLDFVQEVNVYGVSIKNYEGRTGMAAIVLKRYHTFNGERLYKHVEDFLPSYAQPRFVRIMDVMQVTATFKHQKMHLANEGFNPEIISEPLYFMHEPAHSYIPLTKEIYQKTSCLTQCMWQLGNLNSINSSVASVALIDPYMQLTCHCTVKKAAAYPAVVTSNWQTAQVALTVAKIPRGFPLYHHGYEFNCGIGMMTVYYNPFYHQREKSKPLTFLPADLAFPFTWNNYMDQENKARQSHSG